MVTVHRGTKDLDQLTKHILAISDDRNVDIDILPNRGRIDIDVDDLGVRTKLGDLSRHAIVKPCPDGHDQIGIVHRHIRPIGAMHAQHAQGLRMLAREGPKPHQRHVDRHMSQLSQLHQFLRGPRENDTAADIQYRLLRLRHGFSRLFDLPLISFIHGVVTTDGDGTRIGKFRLVHGYVFGNVDQHRPWSPRRRNVERFFDGRSQIGHVFHQKIVLGARTAQTDIICLLECIVSNQASRNLPRKTDHRHGIHVGISQRRNNIGHTGS